MCSKSYKNTKINNNVFSQIYSKQNNDMIGLLNITGNKKNVDLVKNLNNKLNYFRSYNDMIGSG